MMKIAKPLLSLGLLGVLAFLLWTRTSAEMAASAAAGKKSGGGGNETETENLKWEKPLFHNPMDDVVGTMLAFLTVIVGQAGGIGGGGLLVPLYIIVMKLGRFAIPLSKATIFGSAVTGVYLFSKKRHPHADRPLIAYDVSLILEPLTLAGTIVGVLLNTIFPQWLITALLILLLTYTTKKTLVKGKKLWDQETLKLQGKQVAEVSKKVVVPHKTKLSKEEDIETNACQMDTENEKQKMMMARQSSGRAVAVIEESDREARRQTELSAMLSREKSVQWHVVGVLMVTWVVVLLSALLKGGHGAPSIAGIGCGSLMFWITTVVAFSSMIVVTAICGLGLHRDYKRKVELSYEFVKGDVMWNHRNSLVYPFLCTLAGIAAGLLGIGGGMVKSPLMLEMGMIPEVTAATSMFMILFTSSSTTMQFLVLGMLRLDYSLWYGGVGVVGAWAGQVVTDVIVRRYGRPSVVVFSVALVTGLSAVVMGFEGILSAVSDLEQHNWSKLQFHQMCAE